MRKSAEITAKTLSLLTSFCLPGKTGLELDKIAEDFIRSHKGAIPATINYNGYKWTTCISINSGCVHNPPNNKPFAEMDVVKLDLVVDYMGYKSDSAITVLIPSVQPEVQRLATVGLEALWRGIEQAKEGNHVSDITNAIFNTIKGTGFSLCKEFVGHGIGKDIHEKPQVPNIPQNGPSPLLVAGMTLAIEPIVIGSLDNSIYYKEGEWPTWSLVGANIVHNEHTLYIQPNGLLPEVLTLRKGEIPL